MSPTVLIPAAQSDALLREIKRQTQEECRSVTATADDEMRAILAQAHAEARRRMREAIVALRREGRRRTVRAEAQAETEARQHLHRRADATIRAAWPLLVQALAARWRDADGRRSWTTAAARAATERLRRGRWVVEHPTGWSTEEQEELRRIITAAFATDITFAADAALAEGLRIRADGAILDATAQGLLADRTGIAAALLAEVEGAS